GALRGMSDVWVPTGLFLAAFWGVMVPFGFWYGVHEAIGAPGLMAATATGCLAAAGMLWLRFENRARRMREQSLSVGVSVR
ncbi:MAG: hypothetical protein AAF493_12260, partial [Pseudomonadota bacterium]